MKKITIIFPILILLIFMIAGYLWYGSKALDPTSTNQVTFVIRPGEGLNSITKKLDKEKLIKSRVVFYLRIKQLGIENKIQAGTYKLSSSQNADDIAKSLTKGTDDIWVRIIEGLRKEEIASILNQKLGISEAEFLDGAIEGKLFPDTYLVPKDYTADQMRQLLFTTFSKKYASIMTDVARSKMDDSTILTLASIVQKEAKKYEDMLTVASILKKRIAQDWALEVDATIQYALGYDKKLKTWWRPNLYSEDLAIESLYNSRKRKGLPPTPICNPGLSAIKSVIESPDDTPYWFYISNKDGSEMHFAKTLDEHNANIEKYLR